MGVRCFDIDVVTTADQQLLITHPKPLQVSLEVFGSLLALLWLSKVVMLRNVSLLCMTADWHQ